MTISIRPVQPVDREAWGRLYRGYAAFYRVEQSEEMRARVWSWLMDPGHEVRGLVADSGGTLLGLAHFRPFARPLSASVGGFLDDLFVGPDARGGGAAEALIEGVRAAGRAEGWSVIRWITAEDNYRARGLYDRMAERTRWVTYDIRL
ncbi:GNAT family N-acetyltransferase [Albidovulum sediminicola]|uniref:GNAT family N-acetyltransferase n=1 Tax=Albidovulum sediminicola TaxID=2984331 RepID=A0ABT2YYV5_9RHOB|nr:GNAT family N-acetyltransferase [Defluviimonas sp. WL0075]MCV2864042.1 GNAT family N-acetyltransferase [Defluviimonas sp. WL0075]